VRAAPAVVTFPTVGPDALSEQRVRLAANDGGAVAVVAAESDHPALSCRWEKGPGDAATLLLRLDRARLSGPMQATVRVRLGGPGAEVLAVPVTCGEP
jgi:hypothetical protein